MFVSIFSLKEKYKRLKNENERLKNLLILKDKTINESFEKLKFETKTNSDLNRFRIEVLDILGLIGVHKNNELAIKEIKRLKEKEWE
ncbi:hypothetical protein DU473_06685 [Campylobacter novaezeelandiae]|uniref:Uncharacterized protein n=1 Tax=Campylobacter novaezeelandiae TaxID=2267891 RepID=A0A4Q9JVC8_9BACT|nr:hypothetical protein [Campylobacter novaezeelandiae]TBR79833.1 hypothetical protein DU473_06685 [Campylobacter novaezeelandiae]